MWKWALAGAFLPLLLALGGCAWFPGLGPARHYPEEVLPGWEREVEAPFYAGDLPPGASGALGAVWGQGEAWLWAEVISFPDQTAAHREFAEELAALPETESSGLGDEGATLTHPPSGLALEITRVGRFLLLVGSLAASSAEAPAPEEVRRAAQVLLRRLPEVPPAEEAPPPEAACHPPDETPSLKVIHLPLSLDGQDNGTLTLVLEVVPVGEEAGLCRYRFDLYLKCIELGQEDGDPGLRGPGDLFLAGSVGLPCGELGFLTGEVAELPAGAGLEFPDKGVLIASRECLTPCGLQNVPIVLNLILRNHNRVNLLDLMAAFFWALARAQPQAQPLWETAEQLSRSFGPEPGEPEDPEAAAEGVPGTPVGEGEAEAAVGLPGLRLDFQMTVYAHGTCQQVSQDTVRCTAIAGEEGRVYLTARVEPSGNPVAISAVSLPPWAVFQPIAGWGTISTECRFIPPPEAAGSTFQLRFRASSLYGVYKDVLLILDVVAPEGAG